ncbi:MAG: aminotransferase class V-fold PLP-dependent enzyme, partial [Gammaproteobacteria bacterium]|nr:aminotransferase class V-fold PLP-dependent enzyme [Gammaproteobacteria bacterium]
MYKNDFALSKGVYLLNHSVGRPLKTAQQAFSQHFFSPWQHTNEEPWHNWLGVIDKFTSGLAKLFNAKQSEFCPQVNLSSGLTKIVMSLDKLQAKNCVVLLSENDFPSIGFALQNALPKSCVLRFIPRHLDMSCANVWDEHLTNDVDLVLVSHAYSNSGQLTPLNDIIPMAKSRGILTIIDIAQSAGVVPLDLNTLKPDFMIGSSVKWLCGGPGAAYLWINTDQIQTCRPKDVGWFSHDNPFEFDIHDFRFHGSALKFWGGTPSIAPFSVAEHSIDYFAKIGSQTIREHNQQLINLIADAFPDELVSPI